MARMTRMAALATFAVATMGADVMMAQGIRIEPVERYVRGSLRVSDSSAQYQFDQEYNQTYRNASVWNRSEALYGGTDDVSGQSWGYQDSVVGTDFVSGVLASQVWLDRMPGCLCSTSGGSVSLIKFNVELQVACDVDIDIWMDMMNVEGRTAVKLKIREIGGRRIAGREFREDHQVECDITKLQLDPGRYEFELSTSAGVSHDEREIMFRRSMAGFRFRFVAMPYILKESRMWATSRLMFNQNEPWADSQRRFEQHPDGDYTSIVRTDSKGVQGYAEAHCEARIGRQFNSREIYGWHEHAGWRTGDGWANGGLWSRALLRTSHDLDIEVMNPIAIRCSVENVFNHDIWSMWSQAMVSPDQRGAAPLIKAEITKIEELNDSKQMVLGPGSYTLRMVADSSSSEGEYMGSTLIQTRPLDCSHDGIINGRDVWLLYAAWGTGSRDHDFNFDGIVDHADFEILIEHVQW